VPEEAHTAPDALADPVQEAARPLEFSGEDGQARRDHQDRRAGQHEHDQADRDDDAADEGDGDSAKLSQHRTVTRILLILMIVEVMNAVQMSFRRTMGRCPRRQAWCAGHTRSGGGVV